MDAEAVGNFLAPVNAAFNLTSALLLLAGFLAIANGDVRRHRAAMLAAVTTSTLFLVFYLTRVSLTGTHSFAGRGAVVPTDFASDPTGSIRAVEARSRGILRIIFATPHDDASAQLRRA